MEVKVVIFLCYLIGLGSAWNQPNSCYAKQASCTDKGLEELTNIREAIQQVSTDLNRLIDVLLVGTTTQTPPDQTTTMPPNETTTQDQPTEPPTEMCGGPGWRRLSLINMTDPTETCPRQLAIEFYRNTNVRGCGRLSSESNCNIVVFPGDGQEYSRVCGRARGYVTGASFGFLPYHESGQTTLDSEYVDGLSLTHGNFRTHIWTFASTQSYTDPLVTATCPCSENNTITPPFVGNDFFCEGVSGTESPPSALWDGEGCPPGFEACCGFNDPPYFVKNLPNSTDDDIEMRLCYLRIHDFPAENLLIELFELFVQ